MQDAVRRQEKSVNHLSLDHDLQTSQVLFHYYARKRLKEKSTAFKKSKFKIFYGLLV